MPDTPESRPHQVYLSGLDPFGRPFATTVEVIAATKESAIRQAVSRATAKGCKIDNVAA